MNLSSSAAVLDSNLRCRYPLVALVLSLGAVLACHPRVAAGTATLEDAAHQATDAAASARVLAFAGFHAYLLEGDAEKAQVRFDQSVARDPAEPYALYGELLMARRRGHPGRAQQAALDLCERAPAHPLASAAARYLVDAVGTSTSVDTLLLGRAGPMLDHGLRGDAAQLLRGALAAIHGNRGEDEAQRQLLEAMGTPTRYTLVGPVAPFHVLSFDTPSLPEQDGALPEATGKMPAGAAPLTGPFGPLTARVLDFPEGKVALGAESSQGDGYLLAVDLDVPESAVHVIRTVSASAHKVYLDGRLVIARRSFADTESTVSAAALSLSSGKHRLLMRLTREARGGPLSLSVMRADGQPSKIAFLPSVGSAPRWSDEGSKQTAPRGLENNPQRGVYATAEELASALRPEAGETLADFLALRDSLGRDRDGAKALAASLAAVLKSPAFLSARADLSLGDRTLPTKVARGLATRDLEAAMARDPGDVHALLSAAAVALEDGRHLDAMALLKRARAAHREVGYPVPLLQARVELALGVDGQAEQTAIEAGALQPGLCEALTLRYDLARKRDAVKLADGLLTELGQCPGALVRNAEHARMRGDLSEAAKLYERMLAREPGSVVLAHQLSSLYLALRRYDDAIAMLGKMRTGWPRSAALAKRQGELYEFAGKRPQALAAREQALAIDGGDLELRRQVERARTGHEPLQARAIDGRAAIAAYQAHPLTEEATSAFILDAAAVQVYPDGSMVDRIHIIQKALDLSGVSDVAEVNLPQGAAVLSLRTIKADGTVLEPESIEGKDTVSLPGVQVGDYIEYEYLQAHPARGPAQPGFTASSFYFQIARQPNSWSTYTVLAPKGTGMGVDTHNLPPLKVTPEGDQEVFFHEERAVLPFIPEPSGPPSANEFLPMVTVGAGQTGSEGLVAEYADAFLDRGQISFEVEQFARAAVGPKTGIEAVKALYAAVHQKLQGRDGSLPVSASASVAQDRGSRLWALKAGLEAVGIPARIAAVRTFSTDPASYRFPNENQLPYLCVQVPLPEGEVWLDTAVRFAPFGELPQQARGGREAYLLPEPGRPLQKVKTPLGTPQKGKELQLKLKLAADGQLSGEGEEVYSGFEAAQLGEALDALSPDQRDQAIQSGISRYFGGAELSKLKLDLKREVGAPLTLRYSFTAPRFGRLEGEGRMVLGPLTFPSQLGRRFVQLGSRRTALYIDGTEANHTQVKLELPKGFVLSSPAPEVKSTSAFGELRRREKQQGSTLELDEQLRVEMNRIPIQEYGNFARFAGEVDLIQTRDLAIEKK